MEEDGAAVESYGGSIEEGKHEKIEINMKERSSKLELRRRERGNEMSRTEEVTGLDKKIKRRKT